MIGASFGVLLTHLNAFASVGRGPFVDFVIFKYLNTFNAKAEAKVTRLELLRVRILCSNMEASLRIFYVHFSSHFSHFLFFPSFIFLLGNINFPVDLNLQVEFHSNSSSLHQA